MLNSCADGSCMRMQLRALANTGVPEFIPLFFKYIESDKSSDIIEEAVKGLRRMGQSEILKPEVEVKGESFCFFICVFIFLFISI